jgi:hypothetical protein
MSVFVQAQGIKFSTQGGGGHKWQNSVHVVVECPHTDLKLHCSTDMQCIVTCQIEFDQSYEIKSPPWTILWFKILGIFSVENIDRLVVFMFQT